MQRENISVALATFNGEKYIEKQIKSILIQLIDGDEIIVSDDGSTDKTLEILFRLQQENKKIKILSGPKINFNKNFENAILHCENKYIFICDQDDEWMPNKIDVVLSKFEYHTKCIRHDAIVVNDLDEVLIDSYNQYRKSNTKWFSNFKKNTFTGCCMCVEREWLFKLLPFPNDVFYDAWIGILSCKKGNAKIIDEKLIKWCRHEGTVTKLNRNSIFNIVKSRIKIFINFKKKLKDL